MVAVTMLKAKTQLSQLVAKAEAGEEVVIMRDSVPAVRLVPVSTPIPVRKFGALRNKLVVGDAFFDPLPADELSGWE